MTRLRRTGSLAVLTLAVHLLAGCRSGKAPPLRVVVLGFDGMDYAIASELMSRGRMPNFSRLAKSGAFSRLLTTIPPQSPVAWSSFITGLDPAGHGIFDFVHRDPGTMTPYLSTTRTEAASKTVTIGSWVFSLSSARVELLRDGQPFWDVLEQHGVPTTIMRMPANFPPSGLASRELSGMGTPDILGTYGTFSFFSSAPGTLAGRSLSGGRVHTVSVSNDIVEGELIGPDNPYRTPARKVSVHLTAYLDGARGAAKIVVDEEERLLRVGEWSDWVPIDFRPMPFQALRGMCRFYLKSVTPTFELYVSPIDFDPAQPAMPISTPGGFAAELAQAAGRFYTQGIAEDTNALNEGVLGRSEFLQQAKIVGDEITRQYLHVLERFDSGLLFYHFGNLDQVSHMMWRPRDRAHPAYDATADSSYADVIDGMYVAFDDIVGQTLERLGKDTLLVVMSDHGFAPWRRAFNLNSWLRDNGYLGVIDPALREDPGLFGNVDWSRTRAYGLGLNGLYINVRGRERWGIVQKQDRKTLVDEIASRLLSTIDPQTGQAAVTKALARERAYNGSSHLDVAPDLIVGYAAGTRSSNESALGGLSAETIVDNKQEWSGDHCMDWDAVPGLLLTNRPLRRSVDALDKLAGAILAEYGIEEFPTRHR